MELHTGLHASRGVGRCIGTFGNYMSYLRAACLANGYDAPPVGHPAIRRAMVAVAKRELFTARPKMFIQRLAVCVPILVHMAVAQVSPLQDHGLEYGACCKAAAGDT